ncbi:putative hydrolase [Clostridium pasteurianum DSM 525 = ATCC 6013]|uniref:7TM receptor with intracellular metal dependent phosphohydrolase n=1 Tax=Clostridium pasteurianum DSM 525 = ATCC 6013 TaxID=1262449 RepID=A0A0H3J367_CLOPA|nr:HD family phosphohydrolase [Clostridium pasteurianum]AJA48371.1 putative hydrolase [Clostridium pasteurianum DSM 525 = ATCC 6013]AJA52359.1 putative hydrolase [Clostridium pasteurianum DSM 525 = ATCC 6013]AOZ75617.1 phosphohydrolase [Clostridium pasteurianum DSM 525 = ATCC 6013]AOZ79413.1 phosphohydrolase [Clostridium pasteurianum]ELP60479.1 Membrane protein containing HD superfamily hydrolase domain [Clostridium pasteurianum DSM 525 = ATCC 6013]
MKVIDLIEKKSISKIYIYIITFIIIYLIMLSSVVTQKYDLKEGDIAKVDIKASREVEDRLATDARRKQAANSVGQQYNKRTEVGVNSESDLNNNFDKINNIRNSNVDVNQKSFNIRNSIVYNLSDQDVNTLITMNKDEFDSLRALIIKSIKGIYSNDIREGNSDDIKKAQDYVNLQFTNSKFTKNINDLGIEISNFYIKPNLFLDEDKTNEIRDSAEKKVSPVIIKKDQIIVKEGEPVTKEQLQILQDLGLLNSNNNFNWFMYINLAVLILVVLFIEIFYLYKFHEDLYKDNSKLILIFLLNIISLILARSIYIISPFLIPLACMPMLLILLINDKVSLFISILNCILISGVVEFNAQITLISVTSALLPVIVLKKMQMRNDILYSSIYVAVINSLITFSVGFLISNNVVEVLKITGFSFLGACISAILTVGFLPFLESTFDIVTTVKLLELSNPNQPLLKRLLMEAPGTYHHSILVANIAEVAAENIGGNPVLTRVCAYYHDIGKIIRPYFFKENQIGNDNPHDKISPNLSALVIISHVKDGLELAKEYKLPKAIQDTIVEHHGTTLVKYFYITMKNLSEKPEDISEESFKYPGPIPTTKENAVIMLADSVEASVRSISNPTRGKIEEMVNNIIKSRLNEGQLDNCDLTLKDIDIIRKSFLKTLDGIYHQRIEYPIDKSQIRK